MAKQMETGLFLNRRLTACAIALILLCASSSVLCQTQKMTLDDFSNKVNAAFKNNDITKINEIILNNRLLTKPFIDRTIREAISAELAGNGPEYIRLYSTAHLVAQNFESLFGERSLKIAVEYIQAWNRGQKEMKLRADSIYSAGTQFRLSGKNKEALETLSSALEIYCEINDERFQAEVLGSLGAIYFSFDYSNTKRYYSEALTMREKVDDRQLVGNTLNSMGSVSLKYEKDYVSAIRWYDKALDIRKGIGDMAGLRTTLDYKASALIDYASQLCDQGIYPESLAKSEEAAAIYTELGNQAKSGEAISLMGFVYSNIGDYNMAVEKLSLALEMEKQVNDSLKMAGVMNHLGVVMMNAGRYVKSEEYLTTSFSIYNKLGDLPKSVPVLINLGTLNFYMKDYAAAEKHHAKALELSREVNDTVGEVSVLLNLANDRIWLGKTAEAEANYQEGLKIARSMKYTELIWKTVAGMAETYESRGDFERAIALNDTALAILDGFRTTMQTSGFKTSFMAKERYAFEDIISMLGKLHEKYPSKGYDTIAFLYAERSKSRSLLDLLAESTARQTEVKPGNEAEVKDLKYSRPLSINETQGLCPDKNTVILEYSVGDSSSCLWVICQSYHKMFNLPGRARIQEAVETLRFGLQDPAQGSYDFIIKSGRWLYENLVKPSEPYLSGKSRLVIIPDGILNYLPFEVLLTENKDTDQNGNYSNLPYLIKRYPVSYVQSASVLKILLNNVYKIDPIKPASMKLVAFGDPLHLPHDVKELKRLENSGKEVLEISSFFRNGFSETYLGDSATEENVKMDNKLGKFSYIHFATHGIIDENRPDESRLVLSRSEGSAEDGYLKASEISGFTLKADLVTLSACQTGLGKLVRGEGILGLTRAFMYAGTQSVLVSLWSVSDTSTADLMGEFYRHLVKGKLSKTNALRKAQLAILDSERYSHPFYWAPFVLIGEWD